MAENNVPYLTLNPDVEEAIRADRAAGRVSPYLQHHERRLAAAERSLVPEEDQAGEPNQIVVDYMASMTDSYFMAIYRHLFPTSRRKIQTRGYCADLI